MIKKDNAHNVKFVKLGNMMQQHDARRSNSNLSHERYTKSGGDLSRQRVAAT